MMDDIAIKVEHVGKDFVLPHEKIRSVKSAFTSIYKKRNRTKGTQHALHDINFEIKKGEFFGIVGRNGSGKSTLLKILAGIYRPTKGRVHTYGKLVPFIELGVGFNPELTGRENVYLNGAMLGFSKKEVDAMYADIVTFAELERFMDQKLKNYSSGMQVRLAFSMATRSDADILLVDEVLAVGDADFQRKCYEYFKLLKRNKKTVVFVSHDMNAIREFCDRAMLIEDSKLVSVGKTQTVASQYSQLFLEESHESDIESESINNNQLEIDPEGKRWGNGKIKIQEARAKVKGEKVIVEVRAKANVDIDNVIYGLHFEAQDGTEVTAMNNRMVNMPDLTDVRKGSEVTFAWEVLNIFNDGNYFINLTLVNDTGEAFDWYMGAAKFSVKREERSTTSVLPPLKVTYTIK